MAQEADVTQGPLTTEAGAPVADNQNSETAGAGGPVLVQDQLLLEKLAHFNRERIPERVVHARGAGAYGTFTVTADVTPYTRAAFLSEIGKRPRSSCASRPWPATWGRRTPSATRAASR
ncbi:hypothetical protein GCM10010255_36410 [Streptomyces coeruleofuscus]|uniref:Catalase core domain-containing protein n=1 Tax=Streptomyces coeruleofuscus TaxID=66879 RepID=A0ABN3IBZ7_9ACTN